MAEWTAPLRAFCAFRSPRHHPAAAAAVVNLIQVWAELAGSLFALQRRTWASIA